MLMGEVMLLLLLKKNGKLPMNYGQYFRNTIPATIVEDLRILGKIKIESEGKGAYIVLADDSPTNETILDSILNEISSYLQTGKQLNLVKFLKSLGDKKRNWQDRLWDDLEIKGIIKNQKGKHILLKPEVKESIENEVIAMVGNKKQLDEHEKSLIAFFKHTRQLRMVSKKSERDKEWINSFAKDRLVPKIFARHVLMPVALKRTGKVITVAGAVGSQVRAASAKASSDISAAGSDFMAVQGIGRSKQASWAGLRHDRALKGGSSKLGGIGGSPGDAILKGVKKLVKKKDMTFCITCGKQIKKEAKFCVHCGFRVP